MTDPSSPGASSPRFGSPEPASGWEGAPAPEPPPASAPTFGTPFADPPTFESSTARFGSADPPTGEWAQVPAPEPTPAPPPPPPTPTPAPAPAPAYTPPPAAYTPPTYAAPAPLTVDPMTGQPYSDKSKLVAGLLQLLLGFVFALGGVGRLYAGQTTIGVIQIVASVVAWASFWCGFFLILPFLLYGAIVLWFVIDGVLMLVGRPVDGQGRLLRP